MRGGGGSKPSVKGLSGYTLAEVVVVMLIIAAIVAVSIRITRSKLDSVIFYTYYSAYETLKSSTASILADYNPENDDYILTYKRDRKPFEQRLLAYGKQLINNLTPKAFAGNGATPAIFYHFYPDTLIMTDTEYSLSSPLKYFKLPAGKKKLFKSPDREADWPFVTASVYDIGDDFVMCPGHSRYSLSSDSSYITTYTTYDKVGDPNPCHKTCYSRYRRYPNGTGEDIKENDYDKNNCGRYLFSASSCTANGLTPEETYIYNKASETHSVTLVDIQRYNEIYTNELAEMCMLYIQEDEPDEPSEGGDTNPTNPGGGEDGGSAPDPENPGGGGGGGSDPDSPEHCTQAAPTLMPCGKRWDTSSCSLVDITPFPPTCDEGYEFNSKDEVCACVSTARTIPRKGANFCKLFAERVNTKSNTIDCGGSAITSDKTDFSSDTPDIVLRNGIKIYNMSQNPAPIPVLANNIDGGFYKDGSGNNVKINEYGYTVYVDVDGNSGDSILWQDVYPFYITMSGRVIPAYDKSANPDGSGGDSKQHLQVSVLHEMIADSGYWKRTWLAKSVSFQEGACIDGYVGENTPYCSNGGYRNHDFCMADTSSCTMKTIRPIKFFF